MKRVTCLVILLAACWPLQGVCAEEQPGPKAESEKGKEKPRAEPSRPKRETQLKKFAGLEMRIYDIREFQDVDIVKKIRDEIPGDWGADGGRSIEKREHWLIVMQTPEKHKVIEKHLKCLRCERAGTRN